MNETAIKTENLGRDYGRFCALSNVNFTLERGRVVALLGPNGAGKTTLLHLLTGQLEPTRGGSQILGYSSRSLPDSVVGPSILPCLNGSPSVKIVGSVNLSTS